MYIYAYIIMCMYVCIYIYVYVYMYTVTELGWLVYMEIFWDPIVEKEYVLFFNIIL